MNILCVRCVIELIVKCPFVPYEVFNFFLSFRGEGQFKVGFLVVCFGRDLLACLVGFMAFILSLMPVNVVCLKIKNGFIWLFTVRWLS